jgi:hypothetical protein
MKNVLRLAPVLAAVCLLAGPAAVQPLQETDIQKAKIYLETYPLLTETDLYCSFFVWDGPPPELKIAGAERAEFDQHSDGEVVYLKAGRARGVAVGQQMLIIDVGTALTHPRTGGKTGPLCFRRGRLTVIHVEEDSAAARIEKSCGPVWVGSALIPFEVKPSVEGKNEGYVPYEEPRERLSGSVFYLQDDLNQAGPPSWVLIDIGREEGLKAGRQLTIFRRTGEGLPRRSIGNGVVVDVQERTATMRIIVSEEAVVAGDGVEVKEPA